MTPDTMEINGSKYVREGIWLEAERELSAVSAAIGSVRWVDLPDGGSVSLVEQVGRMRADLERYESALKKLANGVPAVPMGDLAMFVIEIADAALAVQP